MATVFQHNIALSFFTEDEKQEHDPFVYEHVLGLIVSGSVDFYTDNKAVSHYTGTLSLIRKNQLVKAVKKIDPVSNKFISINIFLTQDALKKYSLEYGIKSEKVYSGASNVLLENDAFMRGYFDSLLPYLAKPEILTPILAQAKTTEAIELLLRNPVLKDFLFDFSEPYKIDLEAYMNRHFSYNVPLVQFAKLTGRSLSSFKRDFMKIFSVTPEKWLQKRRLEMAHFLISQKNRKPSDVYLEVGFENLSHFSTVFKKEFGVNASSLQQKY
ncbi:AraC family transcriptional regulator [Chitinophaga sancti]|uniref:helix-turn-helix domain-containing protein n=1 Tax=Chitinophaga sancti TaxID=1004 RepID=UPI002A75A978|nr:AraC family transcriptional regulator [Chitinophaga sancti]WPQ63633.1 AraC family transcriptional regulator [Chitinophaga sancti]